jgi:hypothetical protein
MPTQTILVHGYSAESKADNPNDVTNIFGTLADRLTRLNIPAIQVDVSRYVSMDDGRDVDDISLAVDRVLRTQYPELLDPNGDGFNAIIHSTGALVMRNWVRRHCPIPEKGKRSPLRRIIHLAGANLGSGWAHIGASDLAKWLRFIGQDGSERGLAVLSELELGSSWAIELHGYFRNTGTKMLADYGIYEFNIVGTQAPPEWLIVPFRYGKEDGSDGVVRVAASNLNFNYVEIVPAFPAHDVDFKAAIDFSTDTMQFSEDAQTARFGDGIFAGGYYKLGPQSIDGSVDVPEIPLAIPYNCAHSTDTRGIVSGTYPMVQVEALIKQALTCETDADYAQAVKDFDAVTEDTYNRASLTDHVKSAGLLANLSAALQDYLHNPQGQYNKHAQVIIRVFDQNNKPVPSPSVHFNSNGGDAPPVILIDALFEDTHQNTHSPNTNTYYIRTHELDKDGKWAACLPFTNGVDLEIDCVDPLTKFVEYVPLRLRLSADLLTQYVQAHRTTIIDVHLLRLPATGTFSLYSYPAAVPPPPPPPTFGTAVL